MQILLTRGTIISVEGMVGGLALVGVTLGTGLWGDSEDLDEY